MKQTEEEIVEKLLETISEAELNTTELVSVLTTFLFSIGVSLDGCGSLTSEQVLLKYAKKPTLGSALMAQSILMKETWKERKQNGTE